MTNYKQTTFQAWIEKEKKALELINVVGQLRFERSIELVLFRQPLFDIGSSEVLATHQYAREITQKDLSVYESLELAKAIKSSNLAPSRIDIGKLAVKWVDRHLNYSSIQDFITKELSLYIGKDKRNLLAKDVVLYGFGRIGRLIAREIIGQTGKGEQLRLKAIVARSCQENDLQRRADLLKYDSVHKGFKGTIAVDAKNRGLIINGQYVQFIASDDPASIDYTAYGINDALLIDNTGVMRAREDLGRHLQAKGISKVLLTAPGKGNIPNIVAGVNEHIIMNKDESIFSAASCTTNAIIPVLQIMHQLFTIRKGHIETIHAYTNDQNLLDNYHHKERRGRSAAGNMVITETGAAKAISKIIPSLEGKLTGNAVRVPIPNGSLAILHLHTVKALSLEQVEQVLKEEALFGKLSDQIDYSIAKELVSSDVIGNCHAGIIDGPSTIISSDGKSATVYVWYDNEYGYSRQVIRLAKKIANVARLTYY